ncbi:4-hydroxy-2-oxo-heptane-1,7-dioate aldolase, partial [Salmonella enterica]|nr:4-hydroxy-2-oxo-heptane-1,7-dioate aldolase [Salmonella enterica]
RALAQKKNCPVRPASIKPGPVSAALPGNRSTLQNSHQRKKK